jgi:hypothetical protein
MNDGYDAPSSFWLDGVSWADVRQESKHNHEVQDHRIQGGHAPMTSHPTPNYDLEALIVSSFKSAREKGKPDWRRMSLAVLKNRLLQMTRGQFSEALHGAASLRELFERYPQLVKVDGAHVELLENGSTEQSTALATKRVRADLWRAAMDYSSGTRYAWDRTTQSAREATDGDTLMVPTLSKEEMQEWRDEFAQRDPSDPKVLRWKAEGLTTYALPSRLRHEWNRFVQSKITARLTQWLKDHSIDVDLTENEPLPQAETPTDGLRSVVIACVQVMTREELSELRIPASVVYRAQVSGRLHG